MKLKTQLFRTCLSLLISCFATQIITAQTLEIKSPNEQTSVSIELKQGFLSYAVSHGKKTVLKPSALGLLTDHGNFFKDLHTLEVGDVNFVSETYDMLNSKQSRISYAATCQTVTVQNADGKKLSILFHVADNGVAYRYSLAGKCADTWKIEQEMSAFNLPEGTRAWIQPMPEAQTGWSHSQPSYEEHYLLGKPVEELDVFLKKHDVEVEHAQNLVNVYPYVGWVFPALFQTETDGTWILLSETAVDRNYCASRLVQEDAGNTFSIGFPMDAEKVFAGPVKPESSLPWLTPWRLIVVGNSLKDIVESTIGTDLAKPAIFTETEWIKPGKASWSWVVLKDDSMQYDVQKRFIEYAAKMGWEYTLIDADWDWKLGYDKVQELVDYGKELGVGLLLWYNSSGSWNTTIYTPKSKLLTPEDREEEFKRISEMGIKGVKVDFFPGDGQSVMAYYDDLFRAAAKHKLMINTHGTTLPRGWHRTYPNLLTMESVRGMEFITFTQDNADRGPSHMAILPFTRNVFDPMDFTPMVFSDLPGIQKRTLKGFELALPVVFQSGIQHLGETDTGMANEPTFIHDLLRKLPTVWDETQFIDGFPGEYAILARRTGSDWYVGGINAKPTTMSLTIQLPRFDPKGDCIIYTGDPEKDELVMHTLNPDSDGKVVIPVKAFGGFVITFAGIAPEKNISF